MDPQLVCYLHLALQPSATETQVLAAFKNASLLLVGWIFDDGCQAIFKTNCSNSWTVTKTNPGR